ncbi:uncharacterized protein LOC591111 [Strongylocentrotus purpuratus]|uniref:Decapping nuclease n=1 Tax=Strongylocentrotus purpuratus TaxID=7668 RepID=A0A7M7N959_STRPU|nr:uncharacterized protein LOC591111 [Strongylocentrotus purpuratus]
MASNSPDIHDIEVLGTFSIDEKGNYQNDSSQRRFLVETVNDHLQFDLRDGIDDYIAQNQRKVRYASLSSVQDWIHDNMQELTERKILETERGGTRKLNVDFVGSTEVFSLLLRACECIDRLEILVRRCNGTYYIESSPRKYQRSSATTPARYELSEMKYAGRKFATSITSTDEGGVPTADEPVNANATYVVVMKRQLGDHSFILSTDVQAERIDSIQTPPGNYVCIRSRKAHLVGNTNFKK